VFDAQVHIEPLIEAVYTVPFKGTEIFTDRMEGTHAGDSLDCLTGDFEPDRDVIVL